MLTTTHCVIRQFVGNKLTTSHCVIRQFVGNVYPFNSHKVKLSTSHCVIRQFYFVGNVYHFNSRKVKQQQFLICAVHYSPLKNCCSVVSVKKK